MRPSFAFNNQTNCGSRDTKSGSDLGMDCAGCGKGTNLTHVITCQPSLRVLCPKGLALPANHIMHVFLLTADNQMVRIDTTRIVAGVAYDSAGWYGAIVQFVTKTVGKYPAPTLISLAANAHCAVSIMTLCSNPQPTVLRRSLDDILPKALCNRASCSQAIVVTRDEMSFRRLNDSTTSTGAADRAWVWVSACIVAAYVLPRFALDVAVRFAVSWRNLGFLPTTTVAVTVWDFLRSILSGMLAHVVSPSKAIGQATGRSQRRGGAFRLTTGAL